MEWILFIGPIPYYVTVCVVLVYGSGVFGCAKGGSIGICSCISVYYFHHECARVVWYTQRTQIRLLWKIFQRHNIIIIIV